MADDYIIIDIIMDVNELKSSGLLELYVLGQTSQEETALVETMLDQHPELKQEISEISNALEVYASTVAEPPSPSTKEKLMEEIRKNRSSSARRNTSHFTKDGSIYGWLAAILGLLSLGLAWLYFTKIQDYQSLQSAYEDYVIACDSIQRADSTIIARYEELKDPNNQIININATEKYPESNLYFHYNPVSGRNFLQIKNLPPIAANQSYQLWSLKGDQAIPLDVFQGDGDNLFEVLFEENSDAYAITIEPRGGQDTPTLDNMIGVIPVS